LPEQTYGLILCSHMLFLYHEQFDEAFHIDALREMLRLCKPGGQIRIYPLLTLSYVAYPGLDRLIERICRETGATAEFEQTGLPFIPESSQVLIVSKPQASIKMLE